MSIADHLRAWVKTGLADPQAPAKDAAWDRANEMRAELARLYSAAGRDDWNGAGPVWLPMEEAYLCLLPLIAALMKRISDLEERVDEEAYKVKRHETELFGE